MPLSCISAVKRNNNNSKRPTSMPNVIFACFTGDRSGSMCSMGASPAEGLYDWIKEQSSSALNNNQKAFLTVSTFDDKTELKMDNVPAKNVVISAEECRQWMFPRGMTRLFDTAIEDLERLQQAAQTYRENCAAAVKALNPKIVMIWALLTDGQHNIGHKSAADLHKAVTLARKNGVVCYFLAANQDACRAGATYGFAHECSLTFDSNPEYAGNAYKSLNTQMLHSASTGAPEPFSMLQRNTSSQSSQAFPPPPSLIPPPPSLHSVNSLHNSPPSPPTPLNYHNGLIQDNLPSYSGYSPQ